MIDYMCVNYCVCGYLSTLKLSYSYVDEVQDNLLIDTLGIVPFWNLFPTVL